MNSPFALTIDGFERQWQVLYLAPHILTSCLTPLMLSTAAESRSKTRVRVVNVASDLAFWGPKKIQLGDVSLTSEKGLGSQQYVHLHEPCDSAPMLKEILGLDTDMESRVSSERPRSSMTVTAPKVGP